MIGISQKGVCRKSVSAELKRAGASILTMWPAWEIERQRQLDILSQRYYGNPYHGWLILLANPQFGGLEFDIPDNEIITIPYPFRETIQEYTDKVQRHINLFGI